MNLLKNTIALVALAVASTPAIAGSPTTTGALATPANRIVGTWYVQASVNGNNCMSGIPGPALSVRTYLVFHAGGTITELPRIPVTNIPTPRTFGIGNWYFDPVRNAYYGTLRFDWYANGFAQGYQTVDREIFLAADADTMTGSAVSVRYLENGTEVYSQCGSANGTRL